MLLLTLAGCEALQPAAPPAKTGGLSPVLDRMRRAYPDLESGRFISLADFESPGQVALFRVVGPDGDEGDRPQPAPSILRSRDETGAASLRAVLQTSDDRLVFDGQRSTQLALIRDWRKYALLLMSIYGPPDGATVEFGVQSGLTTPLRWSRTIAVRPGWNLYRFDLATLGDTLDLADIRALSWHTLNRSGPAELHIDDLILADNTRYRYGENAEPGEPYLFTRGLRIGVGVRGRFELEFSDGLITAWRDAGGENLADAGGLGPWPVPLPDDWATRPEAPLAYDDPQLFAAWGEQVAATQRVVEATPFRAVIEGEWRFLKANSAGNSEKEAGPLPGHRWRYVIYPSGRGHVQITSHAGPGGWGGARLGYVIGLDGRRDFHRVPAPAVEAGAQSPAFVLVARRGAARADLLWTWPRTNALPRQRELVSVDERRLAIVAGEMEAAEDVTSTHLLRFWPADMDTAVEAQSLTADFQGPATLTATSGRVLTDMSGDRNHDGYNEAEGCYEVAAEGGVARFGFDPGAHVRFDPVLRIHDMAGRRCWVYARGRTVEDLGRDVDDNLLFILGRVAGAPVAIEVHSRGSGAAP